MEEIVKISIEYCKQWNYGPRASSLETELKKDMGQNVDVELIAGSDGVFEIVVDNRLVFSKEEKGRFPDDGEILNLIGWTVKLTKWYDVLRGKIRFRIILCDWRL